MTGKLNLFTFSKSVILAGNLKFLFFYRKRQKQKGTQNSPQTRYPCEGSDNQAVNNNQAQPLATSARHDHATSTQPYNRSVLTGASSSTGSSGNNTLWKMQHAQMRNPPPSPNTAIEIRQARNFSTLPHSTRSLSRARQARATRAPPTTPAQTEISESESGLYRGHYMYESDFYAGGEAVHPPTPRSQYEDYSAYGHALSRSQYDDYGAHAGGHAGHAASICSEPPEEERTFIPQERAFMPPPPSRCDSPT